MEEVSAVDWREECELCTVLYESDRRSADETGGGSWLQPARCSVPCAVSVAVG